MNKCYFCGRATKLVVGAGLDECPKCKVPYEVGFGLAGGGYGAYTYCPQCGGMMSQAEFDEFGACSEQCLMAVSDSSSPETARCLPTEEFNPDALASPGGSPAKT